MICQLHISQEFLTNHRVFNTGKLSCALFLFMPILLYAFSMPYYRHSLLLPSPCPHVSPRGVHFQTSRLLFSNANELHTQVDDAFIRPVIIYPGAARIGDPSLHPGRPSVGHPE